MDPYIEIISLSNNSMFKTKVIDEGGKNPVWNQQLDIPLCSFDEKFKFSCYDENVLTNSLVGDNILRAQDLIGKK